jgi:predicted ATPase
MIKKYVLTGGPYCGKTTLLLALKRIGYQAVPEAATMLIEQELKKGNPHPWNGNVPSFQKKLLEKQLLLESKLKDIPTAFVDRGILDGLAYCKIAKITPPEELITAVKKVNYAGIFLLDYLPTYNTNEIRVESIEKALEIHQRLHKIYEEWGFNVIQVPSLSVLDRVNFVLKNIDYTDNIMHSYKTIKVQHF